MASVDFFEKTPLAPEDAIFALTAGFKADTNPDKVNLGVGAYRDNNGKPYVLPVVRKVKAEIAADETLDHEYLPIAGLSSFTKASAELIFGKDSEAIKEGRVSTVQTISGTGACHLAALFLARFYGPWQSQPAHERIIYISNPTWANHASIIKNVGLVPKEYPYYDPSTIGLEFEDYLNYLRAQHDESVFLMHACAHNPTGVDPTREQWKEIAEVVKIKRHFIFFDCAYQGFASGDLDNDAWAVRYFVSQNIPLLVCQSYAKNAGLYGERIGALNIVATHHGDVPGGSDRINSQVLILQRSEISNPPTFGARIVSSILNNPDNFTQWKSDIKEMADRIILMRQKLYDLLTEFKTPSPTGNWNHITNQIGMFSFTGLKPDQCKALLEQYHIYLTKNGRISMAGLNENNIRYFAESVDKVVRASS